MISFLFLKRNVSGNVNTVSLAFLRYIALLPSSLSTSLLLCINLYKLLYCFCALTLVAFSIPGPSILILSLKCFLALTSEFIIDYFGFNVLSLELTTLFFEFPHFPLFHFSGSSSVCSYIILVLKFSLSNWHAY